MLRYISLFVFLFSFTAFAVSLEEAYIAGNKVLKQHVSVAKHSSTVNYKALKESPEDLEKFIKGVQAVGEEEFKKFSKNKQLAFLINAYNLYTLKLIVEKYPVKSIKDIGNVLVTPWKKKFAWLKLFAKKVSLDNIEHKMIRGSDPSKKLIPQVYNEPRIHFAVNCASIGCPALLEELYTEQNLPTMLDKATRMFLQDRTRNYYDGKKSTLYLSPIFKWYKEDFGKNDKEVKAFVLKYLSSKDKQKIAKKSTKIEYTDYDWNLNES